MTLVEFLLARIADDERLPYVHALMCPRTNLDYEFDEENPRTTPYPCTCGWPERVIRECEAKRKIVELHPLVNHRAILPDEEWDGVGPDEYETTHCAQCFGCGCCEDLDEYTPFCPTLAAVALPYQNHPDFEKVSKR